MSIAVIYLARSAEGSILDVAKFFASYQKYPAGIPHSLYVIRKGFGERTGAEKGIEVITEPFGPTFFDVPDDGFDINAYLEISHHIDEDYVCFFNTFSEILAPNWLKFLSEQVIRPNVGIAGCTASYESLITSHRAMSKAVWLSVVKKVEFDPHLYDFFQPEIDNHTSLWKDQSDALGLSSTDLEYGNRFTENRFKSLDADFEEGWQSAIDKGGPLEILANFQPFPNPHIRSNGFIIDRKRLLQIAPRIEYTKDACVKFESGIEGLSARILAEGQDLILIDKKGKAFNQNNWWKSLTFRLGNQEDLIVSDNQTNKFEELSEKLRIRDSYFSWGRYIYSSCPFNHISRTEYETAYLGFSGRLPHKSTIASTRPFTISVVVPTRNRLELLRDLLRTFVDQEKQDYLECVVFDNGSDVPISEGISDIDQDNITVFRSERFLSVTDSWNNAVNRARGDYIIVLGDDDGLVPRFYEKIAQIIEDLGHFDMVHSSYFQFFHPGVAPWEPSGTFSVIKNGWFFKERSKPFELSWPDRRNLVRSSLSLDREISFNIQNCVFSRSFLDALRNKQGRVFDSPFPDYYLVNVAMALASKVIVSPEPLNVAGVSRKSFGFTLFNKNEKRGKEILNTKAEPARFRKIFNKIILDGPMYNTEYIKTMYYVWDRISSGWLPAPDTKKYRKLQIQEAVLTTEPNISDLAQLERHLLDRLSESERDFLAINIADRFTSAWGGSGSGRIPLTMYGMPAEVKFLGTGVFDSLSGVFDYLMAAEDEHSSASSI